MLRNHPFHLFLLPLFFVTHGYIENWGLLEAGDAFLLLMGYWLLAGVLGLLSYAAVTKNRNAAALLATGCLSVYFFFGAFHDFLEVHAPFVLMKRYAVQLPILMAALILLGYRVRKTTTQAFTATRYLNTVLLVFLLADLGSAVYRLQSHPSKTPLSAYTLPVDSLPAFCPSCPKPDLFFLLYDEYSSPTLLQEKYKAGTVLQDYLLSRGFRVLEQSRSNYNFTPFSMASILNMSYLNNLPDPEAVTAEDYARCNTLIRNNRVIRFLDQQGYALLNYSVFDLAGHPTPVNQSFLPLKTRLITARTLSAYIDRDLGWQLAVRFPFNYIFPYEHFNSRGNNDRFQQLVREAAPVKKGQPRFIYTHFYMPHPPFFYDAKGNRKEKQQVLEEYRNPTMAAYLDYTRYVNTQIQELVNTIQEKNPEAVIILMSDHGYRGAGDGNESDFFRILNAVYLPDRDYRGFYDSLSGVNQFRVLLNKYYPESFPLLADSTVLLIDRH